MKSRTFYTYTIYENGDIYNSRGKLMSHRIKDGRKQISLTLGEGIRKNFISSRLVYCVFNDIDIETFDKNECVSYKDGNKLNIELSNLYRVYRGDLIQGQKHNAISKLTDSQVQEIRNKYEQNKGSRPINQHDKNEEYCSYRSLAKEYGVEYSLIQQIVKGEIRNESKYKLKKNS